MPNKAREGFQDVPAAGNPSMGEGLCAADAELK